ncbi:MAG TPA: hypothetical protein VGO31_12845 [Microbacteriaceae bacterium]|nr:hypothetical protein [Microbacteriaceae bacterium]
MTKRIGKIMLKEFESDGSGMAPDWSDPPWDLLFPGLSEERAERILALAENAGISYGGEVEDPRIRLSLGLDRVTVQWLRAALSDHDSVVLNPSGTALETITPAVAKERMEGVIEDLDEFLEYGDRYPAEGQ